MRIAVVITGFATAALLLSTVAEAQVDKHSKIGVLGEESSLYFDFGGTLDGKKIGLVGAGHRSKPGLGASIARQ